MVVATYEDGELKVPVYKSIVDTDEKLELIDPETTLDEKTGEMLAQFESYKLSSKNDYVYKNFDTNYQKTSDDTIVTSENIEIEKPVFGY